MNFRFEFQELSLLSQNDFNLRLEANGYAVIEFEEEGFWRIDSVWLEGTKLSNAKYGYERKFFRLDWYDNNTYCTDIYEAIETKYDQDIQNRIREELASLNISIPDPDREHLEVSAS